MKFALWQTHVEPKIAISIGSRLSCGVRIASTGTKKQNGVISIRILWIDLEISATQRKAAIGKCSMRITFARTEKGKKMANKQRLDLIDRGALGIGYANPLVFDKIEYAHGWNCAIDIIKKAPTVAAVELPCKMGDIVWGIKKFHHGQTVKQGTVYQMFFADDMRLCICVKNVCRGEWGKNVFATKEEAVAAIAERRTDQL